MKYPDCGGLKPTKDTRLDFFSHALLDMNSIEHKKIFRYVRRISSKCHKFCGKILKKSNEKVKN